ncbi:hypothetical protein [Flagellimonas algicola]|uniref:Translation elongation factor EFTu-like domain-containing protein n=1 Tax=Flagellimonas algicola TaxID=2583815 RepID=A0ABY2WKB9_9FLAO|nr:hypothetical protein [Allomuricauda algicola]TMU55095.1 hypothetical protein FGG15_12995 [Allomuricauda algicola]
MKYVATYQIHDTFKITGRGIVFAGHIQEGKLVIGNIIKFDFNGRTLERKIKGIGDGMRVVEGYPSVGVMIESLNEEEIEHLRNWSPNKTEAKIYSQ